MLRRSLQAIVLGIALACVLQSHASAQVVEQREEKNPGGIIFKSILYGAGSGLLLGGAYALIEDDEDIDTADCLKWGAAIGAGGGLAIGLIYLATRPEPKGDVEEIGATRDDEDDFQVALQPGLTFNARQYRPESGRVPLQVQVVHASF